ncbi:hypothetical protein SDC9_86811 [bioreactor metagenome]|uniref:Uncharacterized protein n=1 Tax=bioreactor metagenome TaxID=1076179 RepID=A0A644ZJY9_9ZZZZ
MLVVHLDILHAKTVQLQEPFHFGILLLQLFGNIAAHIRHFFSGVGRHILHHPHQFIAVGIVLLDSVFVADERNQQSRASNTHGKAEDGNKCERFVAPPISEY